MASPFIPLKGSNTGMEHWGLGEEGVESPRLDFAYLLRVCANLDGIGNEASCFFFSHGADVFQTNGQLVFPQGQRMGNEQQEALTECSRGTSSDRGNQITVYIFLNLLRDHLV